MTARLLPIPSNHRDNMRMHTRPTCYWDVYMDDFLGLCQGNKQRRQHVKRHLLNSLDLVFRQLDNQDLPHRQEPASIKKMLKGQAMWHTRKIILGWIINTVAMTLELPAYRVQRLHDILLLVNPTRKQIAIRDWHKVLGELRSMTITIPGARGLFSTLQEAFRHVDSSHRVKLGN